MEHEVSEPLSSEQAFRESEARFRATFDQVAVGVAHVGMDNRTIWVNQGLCAMLGYTESELLERSVVEVTHPDDISSDMALAQRLIAGEIPSYRIEKRYLHKNGSVVSADLAVSLVRDAEGTPKYVVGVVVDLTERRRAEARLAAVLASINDHLVSYDRHWRYTFVNDKAAEILGRTKEELLGNSIWELFPDAVGNQYYRELHSALAEQRVIRSEHYYEPFGTWFENHIYPSPDGVTVFSSDVTWRKALQRELQDHAERLAEADRRKDEFLATLAHELRNPLAPVRNGLHLIRLAGNNAAMLEQARLMMERQVHHMVRLVDDLLDVSRISRNNVELRKEWVELASVVRAAVETSRPIIQEAGHHFEVSLPSEPLLLDADPVRLSQALANLLNNAAKYTEHGGQIWLTVDHVGDEVVVRVRDNGIGIPADELSHIFEMFVQVDRSLERSQGGLGIGLTLVKRLIELHGGSVRAESEGLGLGSAFTVRLPLVAVPGMPDGPPNEPAARPTQVRRRVLIVDDNRDAADSLTMMLELLGHEVAAAYEGRDAVALVATFQPDVALLDLGMPKLSGYEAARQIRQLPGGDRVFLVALTGWGQDEDKRRSLETGFDAHVVKPIDRDTLEVLLSGDVLRTAAQ